MNIQSIYPFALRSNMYSRQAFKSNDIYGFEAEGKGLSVHNAYQPDETGDMCEIPEGCNRSNYNKECDPYFPIFVFPVEQKIQVKEDDFGAKADDAGLSMPPEDFTQAE